jgi:hypothetical protein
VRKVALADAVPDPARLSGNTDSHRTTRNPHPSRKKDPKSPGSGPSCSHSALHVEGRVLGEATRLLDYGRTRAPCEAARGSGSYARLRAVAVSIKLGRIESITKERKKGLMHSTGAVRGPRCM